jgi:hypothetical protein
LQHPIELKRITHHAHQQRKQASRLQPDKAHCNHLDLLMVCMFCCMMLHGKEHWPAQVWSAVALTEFDFMGKMCLAKIATTWKGHNEIDSVKKRAWRARLLPFWSCV